MNFLVIPACNEEKRIIPTLRSYSRFFRDWKILVVVNGSTDRTMKLVSEESKKLKNVSVFEDRHKIGKGGAVKAGFEIVLHNAKASDLVGFVDADSSTGPKEFDKLIKGIKTGKVDGAIASRYSYSGKILDKQGLKRKLASRTLNLLVRILFDLDYADTQCGAKLFKTHALKKIVPLLKEKGWLFDIEVLYLLKKKGFAVKEVGINWKNDSRSSLNVYSSPKLFAKLLLMRSRL